MYIFDITLMHITLQHINIIKLKYTQDNIIKSNNELV